MGRGNGGSKAARAAGNDECRVAFCNREVTIARFPSERPMMSWHTKTFPGVFAINAT
jgi:hypothetical protein